jgi:hypothetical protein
LRFVFQVAEVLLAVEDDEEEEAKLLRRAERLARSRESIPWLIWRALRRPIVSTLSLTMPMIERKQDLTYRKVSKGSMGGHGSHYFGGAG